MGTHDFAAGNREMRRALKEMPYKQVADLFNRFGDLVFQQFNSGGTNFFVAGESAGGEGGHIL
jgi:hypothetical protein